MARVVALLVASLAVACALPATHSISGDEIAAAVDAFAATSSGQNLVMSSPPYHSLIHQVVTLAGVNEDECTTYMVTDPSSSVVSQGNGYLVSSKAVIHLTCGSSVDMDVPFTGSAKLVIDDGKVSVEGIDIIDLAHNITVPMADAELPTDNKLVQAGMAMFNAPAAVQSVQSLIQLGEDESHKHKKRHHHNIKAQQLEEEQSGEVCLSAETAVNVFSDNAWTATQMKDLMPGDLVEGADGATEVVFNMCFEKSSAVVQLSLDNGNVLSGVPAHLVQLASGEFVPMSSVSVGSELAGAKVVSVGAGVEQTCAMTTASGTVSAEGVTASVYAQFAGLSHSTLHKMHAPARMLYSMLPAALTKTTVVAQSTKFVGSMLRAVSN